MSGVCFGCALGLLATPATAQLVVGNDQSAASNTMWMVDVSNDSPMWPLPVDQPR